MKVEIETTSGVERKLTIEVPWQRFQDEVQRNLLRIRKRASLKGFRKGKAPLEMVRRIYSEDARQDAVNALAAEAVQGAMRDNELTPFGNPYLTDVKTEEDRVVTMEAVVELEPSFDLEDYGALELEKPVRKVREEEVEGFLESIRERQGEAVTVDETRGLRENDIAVITFSGTKGGEPVEGLDVSDYQVRIGRSELVPGFEEQIVGMKPGQNREFDLTFPDDFVNKNLAGQLVHFNVALERIQELRLPELDDGFARTVGKFETLDHLKRTVREDMERMRQADAVKALRSNLARKLVEDNVFDVPPTLVDRELRYMVQDYGENLLQAGFPNEKIREMILASEGELKKTATEKIRLLYIVSEIGEKEGIKAGKEEIEQAVAAIAIQQKKDRGDLMKEYSESGALNDIAFNIIKDKVYERLLEKAKVTEVETGKMQEG